MQHDGQRIGSDGVRAVDGPDSVALDRLAVAARLTELRNHLGVRRADVCASTKIPPNVLADIESGTRQIDVPELRKLATFYQCPVDYLLGFEVAGGGTAGALARVLSQLPPGDLDEVLRLAQFLRRQRLSPRPTLAVVPDGPTPPRRRTALQ